LHAGLGYVLGGNYFHADGPSGNYEKYDSQTWQSLHYIALYASLQLSIAPKFSLGIGGYFADRIKGWCKITADYILNGVSGHSESRQDVGFQFHWYDCGVQAEAQYNLSPKAGINLRFRQGFVNVFAIS
jgi:hypothetical protein